MAVAGERGIAVALLQLSVAYERLLQVAALQEATNELVQSYCAGVLGPLREDAAAERSFAEGVQTVVSAVTASQAAAAALESAVSWQLREAIELSERAIAVGAEEWGEAAVVAELAAAQWRLRTLRALSSGVALDEIQTLVRDAPTVACRDATADGDTTASDNCLITDKIESVRGDSQAAGEGATRTDRVLAARLEARRRAVEEWVGRAGAAMRGKEVGAARGSGF